MGLDKPETGRGESDYRRQLLSGSEGKGEASEDGPRFSSTSCTDSRVLDSGAVIQANTDNERMVLTAYARGRETKGNQVAKVDCNRTRSGAVEARLEASSTAAGQHLRSELIGQVEHTAAVAGATEVRFREQASTDGKRERLLADWEDRGYDTFVDDDEVVAIRYLNGEPVHDAAIPSGTTDVVTAGHSSASPSEIARSLQRQKPYGGVDDWHDAKIETSFWVGAPGRSDLGAFAAPAADVDYHEDNAQAFWDSLQVNAKAAEFRKKGGEGRWTRPTIERYEVVGEPIDVAFARDTLANPQYGDGGRMQFLIPNFEQLLRDKRIRLVETRDLHDNYTSSRTRKPAPRRP